MMKTWRPNEETNLSVYANRQYLWCLGDWEEDGYRYFYSTRRHVTRDISEQECNELATSAIGTKRTLKYIASPPLGMEVLIDMDMDPYECDATVVDISKIKYKKAKY